MAPHEIDAPERVRTFLKKVRRSQTSLARELGVSRVHLCNVLNGHDKPSLDLAARLEAVTKVPAGSWARRSA
jgi:transcriptional regulator with XRE-family HTH domain